MRLEVKATYENGVLRPDEPLPLAEHERVVVSVTPSSSPVRELAGLLHWSGDSETLRKIAEDPDCGAAFDRVPTITRFGPV